MQRRSGSNANLHLQCNSENGGRDIQEKTTKLEKRKEIDSAKKKKNTIGKGEGKRGKFAVAYSA